ncbi:histidine kinase [Oculatella sp. LEGE 06141]|uniref:histidine kinase n=1 Tax=Oculatella sp. LEGE 06141 TaxID=1828648 RepID=UPI00187F42EA|nr:histidine kinase [Oculatella sp. LEGE 06141]MBE9182492.1 histidine kinase [Oculatella sp. LEGE 06141]
MVNTQHNTQRSYYKRAVGVFKDREDLESVLRALKDSHYDMERVSLIARHVEEVEGAEEVTDNRGDTEAQEGAGIGATTGTVLGGLGGLLIGLGVLAIPGVGPILAAGAEINALASTLAGAGIGAATGGIVGALVGLGIPEEQAKSYNDRIKAGHYLLMVSGTEDDLRRVESILRDRKVEEFNIYDAPDLAQPEPSTSRTTASRAVVSDDKRRTTNRDAVVDTRDIDRDGQPEVVIVDKRDNVQR